MSRGAGGVPPPHSGAYWEGAGTPLPPRQPP